MRGRAKYKKAVLFFLYIALLLAVRYQSFLYSRVHPVYRGYKQWQISSQITSYETVDHGKFRIRYRKEQLDYIVERLKQDIDNYGREVFEFFEYDPSALIEVILFPKENSFYSVLGIPEEQSTIGAYAGGKLMLLSPYGQEWEYDDLDIISNVFVHELSHLVIDAVARGNYPLWFTEGSALYMEYYLLGYEWGSGLTDLKPYSLEDLTYNFAKLDEYIAYRQAFLLAKHIIDQSGRERYLELLDCLGKGVEFSKALSRVMGIEQDDLKYLVQNPG